MAKSNFEKFIDARMEEKKKEMIDEFRTEYLRKLPDFNITLKAFIKEMETDGLWDHVGDMTLAQLVKEISPSSFKNGRSRMTKAEKERLLEKVPEFLSKNSWSKKMAIARGVGAEPKKLNTVLKELVAGKKIKRTGDKGATMYTFVGDKEKPE